MLSVFDVELKWFVLDSLLKIHPLNSETIEL